MTNEEYGAKMQSIYELLLNERDARFGEIQKQLEEEFSANPARMVAALQSQAARLWNGAYIPSDHRTVLYMNLGCNPETARTETWLMAAELRAAAHVIMVSLREPAGLGLEWRA